MKNAYALLFFVMCTIFVVACGDDSGTSAGGMESSSSEEALSSVEIFSSADNFCSSSGDRELSSSSGEIIPALSSAVVDLSSSIAESSSSADVSSSSDKANWALMNPEISYGELTDARDGQVYRTVEIGDQTWMAENLNYAYMVKTQELDSSSFCYDNKVENCEKYGRLYLLSAAVDSAALFSENGKGCGLGTAYAENMGLIEADPCLALSHPVRGICPEGWHLPNRAEWEALKSFVTFWMDDSTSIGYALKTTVDWAENGNGSDLFGFSALPATKHRYEASFMSVSYISLFGFFECWRLHYNDWLISSDEYCGNRSSIRCLKD